MRYLANLKENARRQLRKEKGSCTKYLVQKMSTKLMTEKKAT